MLDLKSIWALQKPSKDELIIKTKLDAVPQFECYAATNHITGNHLYIMSLSSHTIIPEFKNATIDNPTPFMSHISSNPILAFAIYLVSHQIFFNKDLTNIKFFSYNFFAILMSINMFITGGRAGQVAFFLILVILIFQTWYFSSIIKPI